jgi:hypothetical protein
MEQRSLRLGDNVDDYCPRERRVTGHVIVAIVGDAVRQTRCTACDAEHEYKEARVPRKKMKNGETSDLTGGVLVRPTPANGAASDAPPMTPNQAVSGTTAPPASATDADAPSPAAADGNNGNQNDGVSDTLPGAWIGHRPLIRATLPKTENDAPPPRAIPEFTMHQRQGRGFGGRGGFRHGGFGGGRPNNGAPGREANGNGPDGNRAPGSGPGGPGGPGAPGGRSRHRRRHRRPR